MDPKRLAAAHRSLTSLLAIAVAAQPIASSYAQIAPDLNVPREQRPVIDRAANGVPVVDITTPNGSGVSHNIYEAFNVPQNGAILNNHDGLYQSQLAGLVLGNPRIRAGNEARLIVNEVSGVDRSVLAGYLEVAGPSAAVVIANPNGLTCDGCGFVNMPRVTLTTGRPGFDANGDLQSLAVSGGNITVQGAGMDASRVDRLALVARAVEVNAAIHAKDFSISGGRQSYDYGSGVGTPIAGGETDKPVFYLSSSALGGIYGDRIRIVGTESGLGIRAPQEMASSIGDMELRADGQLLLRNASATGRITATSTSGNVEIAGTAYSDMGIVINAANALRINDGAVLGTAGSLVTSSGSLVLGSGALAAGLNSDGSLASSGGSATLTVVDQAAIGAAGLLHGGDMLRFVSGSDLTNAGIVQGNGLIDVQTRGGLTNTGRISGSGDVTLTVTGILSNTADGAIIAGNDLGVTGSALALAGAVSSGRDASFTAKSIDIRDVSVARNAEFNASLFTHRGTMAIGAEGHFAVEDQITIDIDAVVGGVTGLDFAVDSFINRGAVVTDGALTISGNGSSASRLVNEATGRIVGGTSSTIDLLSIENAGLITGSGPLTLRSQTLENSGQITSDGGLSLTGATGINSGTLSAVTLDTFFETLINEGDAFFQASDLLTFTGEALTNRGRIITTGSATFGVDTLTNDGGTIVAQNDLVIRGRTEDGEASAIDLVTGQLATVNGNLTIKAIDATVGGTLTSGRDLTLDLSRNASLLTSGRLQAMRDLALTADGEIDAQSAILANRDIRFTAPTIRSYNVGALNDITFTGTIFNNLGTLTALNDATLNFTASITNAAGRSLNAGRSLTLVAPLMTNAGDIASDGAIALSGGAVRANIGSHTNQATGRMSAAFLASENLGTLTNAGVIFATDLVDLSGETLLNHNEISGDDGVGLSFGTIVNEGLIDGRLVSLEATSSIVNRVGSLPSGGVIQADEALELIAPTVTNNELIASGGTLRIGADTFTNPESLVISRGDLTIDGLAAGSRATLIRNEAGSIESTEGNVVIRAQTLENFGNGVVEHQVTEIAHQFITGRTPPSGLAFYPELISSEGYFQLYDEGRTKEYVWVPSPEKVQEILLLEGITINQWTPTLWQKYAPNAATFDPTQWAIYIPDESDRAPAGSSIIAKDERDVLVSPNDPGQILTGRGSILIDAGLLHNRLGTISANGDVNLSGGSVLNEGVTLSGFYTLRASFNNGTLRGQGWSRNNGTGRTEWLPRRGAEAAVRAADIGVVSSTITATGTLTADIDNSFVNVGTPTTSPGDLSFAGNLGGTILFTSPDSAQAGSPVRLGNVPGAGVASPDVAGGNIDVIPGISRSQLKAFAPAIDGSRFLIETRLPFINLDEYFGSEYFFDRLGLVPDEEIKALGDAYFDTTLIRAQLLAQTGKRFIDPNVMTDAEQTRVLIERGIQFLLSNGIKPGAPLSADQQAKLPIDIVLFEEQSLNGRRVIAPRLYLSAENQALQNRKAADTNATILDIAALIFVNDNGVVRGTKSLRITADDIVAVGGRFGGGEIALLARKAIDVRPDVSDLRGRGEDEAAIVGARTEIIGNNVKITAPDITLQAVTIKGREVDIAAQNLKITPAQLYARQVYESPRESFDNSQNLLLLSDVSADRNINITAVDTAFIRAATLRVGGTPEDPNSGNIRIHAGKVMIDSGQQVVHTKGKLVKSGFTESQRDWEYLTVTQIPTIVDAGNHIEIVTTVGDLTIAASVLKAGEVSLGSAGQVRLEVTHNERFSSETRQKSNMVIQSSSAKGAESRVAVPVEIYADKTSIEATNGIVIQFRKTDSLDQAIEDLSQFRGMAFLKDLAKDPTVDLQPVRDFYRTWDHESWGLSGPAATLVLLAIAVATGQPQILATQVGGSQIAAAAVTASLNSMIQIAGKAALTNLSNPGAALEAIASKDALRAIATTALTAGILEGINQYGPDITGADKPFDGPDAKPTIADKVLLRVRDNVRSSAVYAGVDSVVNDASFGRSFAEQLKTMAIATIGADTATYIGRVSPNDAVSVIAHTALGCAYGAAGSGDCVSGAIGGGVGEAVAIGYESITADDLAQDIKKLDEMDAPSGEIREEIDAKLAEWRNRGVDVSRLISGVAAYATGNNIEVAADAAENSAANNALAVLLLDVALETIDKALLARDAAQLADTLEAYNEAVSASDTARAQELQLLATEQAKEIAYYAAIDAAFIGGTVAVGKIIKYLRSAATVSSTISASGKYIRQISVRSTDQLTEINKTLDRIEQGGPFPFKRDGIPFRNIEGKLPKGNYKEYTVTTPGMAGRGSQRIVVETKTGRTYYSDDHYGSFSEIKIKTR